MALPHLAADRFQALLYGKGGAQRSAGMVLTWALSEERHNPVAQQLVHRPTVLVHGLQRDLEGAVHNLADLLGIESLGQGGEAGDVREEYAHLSALAPGAKQVAARPAVVPAGQPLQGAPKTTWPPRLSQRHYTPTEPADAADRHSVPPRELQTSAMWTGKPDAMAK